MCRIRMTCLSLVVVFTFLTAIFSHIEAQEQSLKAFVANSANAGGDVVTVIDLDSYQTRETAVEHEVYYIAGISPLDQLWVARAGGDTVRVLSIETGSVMAEFPAETRIGKYGYNSGRFFRSSIV